MRLNMSCGDEDFYALKRSELSSIGHGEPLSSPWKHFKQVHNKSKISPVPFLASLIFHFCIETFVSL